MTFSTPEPLLVIACTIAPFAGGPISIPLERGLLFVERQRTTAGYEIVEGGPKTAAGRRAVALDKHTVQILREHRRRQLDRRDATHTAWTDTGYVFTRKDGEPINPNYATTRFRKLTERAGLPPARLHDLRHATAALVLAAARHTRKRIKEKAAKNRLAGRDEKQTPSEKRPSTKKRSRRSRARRNPLRHGK